MEKVKNKYAFIIKTMCYILMPILLLSIILAVISIVVFMENDWDANIENYFETQQFADTYRISIIDNTDISMYYNEFSQYYLYEELELNNPNITKIYYRRYLDDKNFKYLVINKDKKIAFTNYELSGRTDSIEKIQAKINENEYYWNYNKNVITNIEKLSLENIKYIHSFERIKDEHNCEIYTSVDSNLNYRDQYYTESITYNILRSQYENANINIMLGTILVITCIIIVTVLSGKKRGKNEIYLNGFDKLPLEIAGLIGIFIGVVPFVIFVENIEYGGAQSILALVMLIVEYIGLVVCYDTFVKRLKTHTLFKNTLIYRMFKWGIETIKKGQKLFINVDIAIRLAICLAVFIILNYILIKMDFVGIILLFAMWIYTYIWIYKKTNNFIEIKKATKQIYEGNSDIHLDEKLYTGLLKELCTYINDIAGGFSNAIEQGIKSERMKTELITNVSHDIKTPLTSIINYVDLLKKEEMPNEKAKEYLEILDKKSQRLKRLTEDLVEASKASSGNIKLNMEKINVKELINQISGEFEDRLKERKLELIVDTPEEDVYIKADSRYLYRIIEDMYSNIIKYAAEVSRVYVDIVIENEDVKIILKNISKEKLNITADELMQRFVRGEASRNTEGSGLGLSIAESLTTLQNGEFKIYLDGDLFKVIISFKKM